jgi:hypothetical protein
MVSQFIFLFLLHSAADGHCSSYYLRFSVTDIKHSTGSYQFTLTVGRIRNAPAVTAKTKAYRDFGVAWRRSNG